MADTSSTPLRASSPASPAAQQQSTPRQTQESATIVPSAPSAPSALSSANNLSDDETMAGGIVIVSASQQDDNDSSGNNNNPSASTQQSQQEQSLDVRVPKAVDVIKELRGTHAAKELLASNVHITTEEEQEIFFQEKIWNEFAEKMYTAIKDNIPRNSRFVKSATKKYVDAKEGVIDWVAGYKLYPDSSVVSDEKRDEAALVIHSLGFEFSKIFHKLITRKGEKKRVPIGDQIAVVLQETESRELKDYFDVGVAKHVYYVIGWLCHAGQAEADRRTSTNDIGKCIKSLMNNFTADDEEVKGLRESLPGGVTELIDKRSKGKLKYPNLQLYSVFAKVERVYSLLSTPTNFMIFGEETLELICTGIIENTTMMGNFKQLFSSDSFDEETIAAAVAYYMKTFANMRLKDLCYRYNSGLHEGPEVGIRQSLVGTKRSSKKKSAANKTTKRKKTNGDKSDVPAEEDDELESYPDDPHYNELMDAAEEEINEEDQLKECTIHPLASNHMDEE